jgi:hypothetical protein
MNPTAPAAAGDSLWPACGYGLLAQDDQGQLLPTDGWWRGLLARPELAPVEESCQSERALHAALLEAPTRSVTPERLARLQDADAQENYGVFLRFRDALLAAGTVQRYYLSLFRDGAAVSIPPLFVDTLAQLILCHLQHDSDDAFEARAAEMLFRAQRVTVHNGRVLAADRDTVDLRQQTGGLGELGRLLMQAQLNLAATDMTVLSADNAVGYWNGSGRGANHYPYLLDLTHQITRDVGHGVQFRLTASHGGLAALGRVLQRWVLHLLGVQVKLTPLESVDDPQWRWHLGLDAEATALLNDLYAGVEVDAERQRRLLGLYRLDFADPAEMHPDVAGKPVYLGLAMNAEGVLRLKPQNLLINLPLRPAS